MERPRRRAPSESPLISSVNSLLDEGLNHFFWNNPALMPSGHTSSRAEFEAAVTAPYTKIGQFSVNGFSKLQVEYNHGHLPEQDDDKLVEAIMQCYSKNRAVITTELGSGPFDADTGDILLLVADQKQEKHSSADDVKLTSHANVETKTPQPSLAAGGESFASAPSPNSTLHNALPMRGAATPIGPMLINIVRTDDLHSPAVVNVLHLENQLVRNDCLRTHQDHSTAFVQPASYQSLVFNGEEAYRFFPTYQSPNNTAPQAQFIWLLEQANERQQPVVLLIRGIAGHSTAYNAYAGIHERFPDLTVQVCYALRRPFFQHANCVEAANGNPGRPISLNCIGPSQRNFYYSELINIRDLYSPNVTLPSAISTSHPGARRVQDWHKEETDARTGGVDQVMADVICKVRGKEGNKVAA